MLPALSFCCVEKDDILKEFSLNMSDADIDGAFYSIDQWKELYPDDVHMAEVCRAFLLLLDGKLDQARFLFEIHFPEVLIQDGQLASQSQVAGLFYQILETCDSPLTLDALGSEAKVSLCKKRSRFWKGKAILGMVVMATGVVVAAVNPPVGWGMIVSSIPMVMEGIENSEDYHEEMDRKRSERMRQEAELDRTSHFSKHNSMNLVMV
ncbi:hypothetical protein NEPTK9_000219 [Candidatus Neptunochlamydia vexilliferae]|uniref:Uncharacterized protein n=1 Tax=Candidatus Neptunichlamydia vexilliferae TaxID=1651774 RepID=A0ABS0AZG2_9BACT|nr:hypothetical protein [Candidatus Neptunochlamydia vexilliferae]